MKKLLLLLASMIPYSLLAQSPSFNVSFPSPNAASLGTYGEIPVSLHNGMPSISIPLHQVTEGPINVPVSLNYHASGLRPDVHPGWVGNGWALNCGGMITRIVKGFPDESVWAQELTFLDSKFTHVERGFNIGSLYNYLNGDAGWATPQRISTLAKRGSGYNDDGDYYQETEPDEFTFNFAGYSGKFYFDGNHKPRVISNSDIRVELEDTMMMVPYINGRANINGVLRDYTYAKNNLISNIPGFILETEIKIRGFRIITPDGFQYEFGMWNRPQSIDDLPVEASINFFQQVYCYENWDTWYLKRIVTPDRQSVEFIYGPPANDIRSPIASFGSTFAIAKSSGSATPSGIFKLFGPVSASSSSISSYYEGRIIYPVYLTKIITSSEVIDFSTSVSRELTYDYNAILSSLQVQALNAYDKDLVYFIGARQAIQAPPYDDPYYEVLDFNAFKWRKLDSITVTSRTSKKKIKTWAFTYGNTSSERLTLSRIQEYGMNRVTTGPYQFAYNQKSLPPYNSNQTDHWGFYNGKRANLGDLSETYLSGFYSYKQPDTALMKAGILEQITYPTGGYSHFAYDPHQYTAKVVRHSVTGEFSVQATTNTVAGGLRIRRINSKAGYGAPDVYKYYEYSGGILSGDAQYYWKNYTGRLLNGNTYTSDRFVTQTMLPVSTNSVGSHIGYSTVKELLPSNGYTVYSYTNYDLLDENYLATIEPQSSKYSPFTSRSIERGVLTKKSVYSQSNQMLKEETYTYLDRDTSNYIRATSTKQVPVLGGISIEGSSYRIYKYPHLIKSVVTTDRDHIYSGRISNTVDYYYRTPLHLNPTRIVHTDSKGIVKSTDIRYIADLNGNGPFFMRNMFLRNMTSAPMEKTVRTGTSLTDLTKITAGEVYIYDTMGLYKTPMLKEYKKLNIAEPLAVTNFTPYEGRTPDSKYKTEVEIIQYGQNASQIREMIGKDGIQRAYIWGYDGRYPVTEAENTSYAEIAYTGFEEGTKDYEGKWWNAAGFTGLSTTMNTPSGNTCVNLYALAGHSLNADVKLTPSKKYTVSFWQYGSTVTLTTSGLPLTIISRRTLAVRGNWLLRQITFTNADQGLSLNATAEAWLDEVRLCPEEARMTTYAYDPLIGMTCAIDINNDVIWYEYDGLGRLKLKRDNNRNIVNQYEYKSMGEDNGPSLKRMHIHNPPGSGITVQSVRDITNSPSGPLYTPVAGGAYVEVPYGNKNFEVLVSRTGTLPSSLAAFITDGTGAVCRTITGASSQALSFKNNTINVTREASLDLTIENEPCNSDEGSSGIGRRMYIDNPPGTGLKITQVLVFTPDNETDPWIVSVPEGSNYVDVPYGQYSMVIYINKTGTNSPSMSIYDGTKTLCQPVPATTGNQSVTFNTLAISIIKEGELKLTVNPGSCN